MKKIVLLMAVLVVAATAQAQWGKTEDETLKNPFSIELSAGAALPSNSFWKNKKKVKGIDPYTQESKYNVDLSFGMALNKCMEVGVGLGYTNSTNKEIKPQAPVNAAYYEDIDKTTLSKFYADVFYDYYFVSYGPIRLALDAYVGYGMGSNKTELTKGTGSLKASFNSEAKVSNFFACVSPFMAFEVYDHLKLKVYFDFMTLGYNYEKLTYTKMIGEDAMGNPVQKNVNQAESTGLFFFGNKDIPVHFGLQFLF